MSQDTLNQMLTDEQVDQAVRGELDHPVLALMDRLAPQLEDYVAGTPGHEDNAVSNAYIQDNFGFFAEGVDQLGEYSLGPTDIIAIWSKAEQVGLSNYATYSMVRTLGSKFASQGLTNPIWDGIASKLFSDSDFLDGALARSEDVETFRAGLDKVRESTKAIGAYRRTLGSTPEDVVEFMRDGGNIDDFEMKEPTSPHFNLLGRIGENFANGLMPMYTDIAK